MLKYPKIYNHSNLNIIDTWVKQVPNFKSLKYVAQQKYDGCNISFEFCKGKPYNLFSRNQKLGNGADFNGIRNILQRPEYIKLIKTIQEWLELSNEINVINLYGELYGPGIQKRINYKSNKIKFFDVFFNTRLQSAFDFDTWMSTLKIAQHKVTFWLYENTFDELIQDGLEKCKKFVTKHAIEGIVIKPYDQVLIDQNKSPFYIKIKTDEFCELERPQNEKKSITSYNLSENVIELTKFITNNSIIDCKSKILWNNFKFFCSFMINEIKTNYNECHPDKQIQLLTREDTRILSKIICALSTQLFDPKTGSYF
jgi:hypothetical protein